MEEQPSAISTALGAVPFEEQVRRLPWVEEFQIRFYRKDGQDIWEWTAMVRSEKYGNAIVAGEQPLANRDAMCMIARETLIRLEMHREPEVASPG